MTYYVKPRYTPGSPGMVDRLTADRVADEERAGYEYAVQGTYGEEMKLKAEALGLSGIVETRRGVRNGWEIEDLIVGVRFHLTEKQTRIYRELKPPSTDYVVILDGQMAYITDGVRLDKVELKDVLELERVRRLRELRRPNERERHLAPWDRWP